MRSAEYGYGVDQLTSWPVGQGEAELAGRRASWPGGKEKSAVYGVLSTEGKPKAKGQGQGKEWPSWPGGRRETRTSGDAGPYRKAGEVAGAARGAEATRAWGCRELKGYFMPSSTAALSKLTIRRG